MTLPTKIQYKNFEPGEFTGKKDSRYEDTIQLIENFPWDEQRDHLQVSLTNPSITIEDRQGGCLKLALYYEGKFVLHYFNREKQLYTKSFSHYTDTYPYLRALFETGSFDTKDFKKEPTWLLHPSLHFTEQNFHYTLNIGNYWSSLLPASLLLFFSVTMPVLGMNSRIGTGGKLAIFLVFSCFLLVGLSFLALFVNHYKHSRGQVLILSKGNDTFYYGNKTNPQKFEKKNILDIVTYGRKGKGGTYDGYVVRVEINFKDGHSLNASTLIIVHSTLFGKLSGYPTSEEKTTFPYMPRTS